MTKRATHADGQVDVEDPAPGQVLDEEAAQQRTEHGGDPEHRPEQAHVPAALAGRDDVSHDGLGPDHQAPTAQALDGPEGDQLEHRMAESRQRRAHQEDHDGGLEERLAPVLVAELAPQRCRHGRSQQVRGHHPGQMGCAVEVAHDGRQGRRDDGLVERGQEHAQQQRADDDEHPAPRQVEGRARGAGSAGARSVRSSGINPR